METTIQVNFDFGENQFLLLAFLAGLLIGLSAE